MSLQMEEAGTDPPSIRTCGREEVHRAMFRVRHLVSESEIGHRIEDRIDDRLTSGPIDATVRSNPQGAGVAVLNREADQHPSLLRLREVEP